MWLSVMAICRVCTRAFACVCPLGTDLASLRCPNCDNRTGEAVEPDEWHAAMAEQNAERDAR